MTDIVERLREVRGVLDNRWPGPTPMDLEAAEEIERLREALTRISNGGTSVLISATLDECPVNPEVLEQIVKDALSALTPADAATGSCITGKREQ